MKNKYFIVSLFALSLFSFKSVLAQSEPTSTPLPLPSQADTTITDDIVKIRQAVQQKVQEKLQSITGSKETKKGWIGSVTNIQDTRLTISFQSQDRTINVDPEATIIDDKRKKITLDKIKVGQNIIAMGELTQDGSLDTKRIIFYDPESLTRKNIVVGKIADISKSSPIIVLIPTNNKNLQYQVKTDSNTSVASADGSKVDIKTLEAGQRIIAILKQDAKNPNSYSAIKFITTATETPSPTPSTKAE